jgi:hypothetical protein
MPLFDSDLTTCFALILCHGIFLSRHTASGNSPSGPDPGIAPFLIFGDKPVSALADETINGRSDIFGSTPFMG